MSDERHIRGGTTGTGGTMGPLRAVRLDVGGSVFTLPTAPSGVWDQLTANEKAWIEFIRVISCGSDPRVTPSRVRALRALLDAG